MTQKRIFRSLIISLSVFLISVGAQAETKEKKSSASSEGNHYLAVPAISYSSDTGFGFGATGIMYRIMGNVRPYKYSMAVQGFGTTKGRQSHFFKIDYVNIGGSRVRIQSAIGVNVETSLTYCGQGMTAECNKAAAERIVDNLLPSPEGEERNELIRKYYKYRYLNVYGFLKFRYMLLEKPTHLEAFTRWYGAYYRPGNFSTHDNYMPSLYQTDIESKKLAPDEGFSSTISFGLAYDSRNSEAVPTRGFYLETSLRGSSKLIGSNWTSVGYNIDARGFVPLLKNESLVLAVRGFLDYLDGEAPLQDIVKIEVASRQAAFGGSDIGRGISSYLYTGKFKAVVQSELRWTFIDFNLWKQEFDVGASAFTDIGYIAWDWESVGKEPFKLGVGFGAGIFLVWNKRFLVRFNLGLSPNQDYSPGIYFRIGNAF